MTPADKVIAGLFLATVGPVVIALLLWLWRRR